ncbi:MAG: extracellular solute-binding protein family 1 [Acidimicrobiaceae bacterium]|jgi:iron(III) transport system substrate-binding protein|nr:extracellular solute-binding protein family 1 [Acidimicrobiaceae bacterium]
MHVPSQRCSPPGPHRGSETSSTRGRLRPYRLASALAALATAGIVASAIGPSSAGASTTRTAHASKTPLSIYAAEGYDATLAKAFQQATGIKTSVYDAHTGIVLAKIQAEKNNPQWGLVWIDGDMALAALDKQHMLVRNFEPNVSWTAAGAKFVPSDRSYIPTGYTVAGSIIYNSSTIKTPPKSWSALLSASYKGKFGILNPAIDGPAYPMVAGWAAQLGGVPAMEQYVTKLMANGAQLFNAPADELNAIKQGTIQLAIAQSSYGIGVNETNPNLKVSYPANATPVPSVIGIDSKASKAVQAEAEQFASFVVSAAGQRAMHAGDPHGDSLYWPIVKGVAPLSRVPSASLLPIKAVDPYQWGPLENTVNRWFTTNVAAG